MSLRGEQLQTRRAQSFCQGADNTAHELETELDVAMAGFPKLVDVDLDEACLLVSPGPPRLTLPAQTTPTDKFPAAKCQYMPVASAADRTFHVDVAGYYKVEMLGELPVAKDDVKFVEVANLGHVRDLLDIFWRQILEEFKFLQGATDQVFAHDRLQIIRSLPCRVTAKRSEVDNWPAGACLRLLSCITAGSCPAATPTIKM